MRPLSCAALVVALAGCLAPAQLAQERMLPDAAPGFTATTPDGLAWDLAAHRGQTLLLDVMAVDCSACRLQTPLLLEVARRHPDLAMLSIELGTAFPGWGAEDQGALVRYHEEHGLTWPIASDPNGTVFRDYRVLVLPTLVVVRPDGGIERALLGERSLEEIDAAIADASRPR